MSKNRHSAEMHRYADSKEGICVWYRHRKSKSWVKAFVPEWHKDYHLIIDDKHAKLRKLQIDEPNTKFEFQADDGNWFDTVPTWLTITEYRVKVKHEWEDDLECGAILCWCRDYKDEIPKADVIVRHATKFHYQGRNGSYRYAEPIKPKECYIKKD